MQRKPGPSIQPTRRMRGFEATASLLKDRIRTAGESRGFAVARLLTHWAEIAGTDMATMTRPVKVGHTRAGMGASLTLLCRASHAPMIQLQLPDLRERVNAVYGYSAIARIVLTQTAPTGFADGQANFVPAVKPALPAPALPGAAACRTAEGVHDDGLRAALEALAQNVLSRSRP